jgi:hypothetical protein
LKQLRRSLRELAELLARIRVIIVATEAGEGARLFFFRVPAANAAGLTAGANFIFKLAAK